MKIIDAIFRAIFRAHLKAMLWTVRGMNRNIRNLAKAGLISKEDAERILRRRKGE